MRLIVKIESIQFNGFKSENRAALVEFSGSNVTVIYGDNGSGKTTFLKAIYSFLSQDGNSLLSIGVSSIECFIKENGENIRSSIN